MTSAPLYTVLGLIMPEIASGETGRTTGHLSVDNEYNDFLVSHSSLSSRNGITYPDDRKPTARR